MPEEVRHTAKGEGQVGLLIPHILYMTIAEMPAKCMVLSIPFGSSSLFFYFLPFRFFYRFFHTFR